MNSDDPFYTVFKDLKDQIQEYVNNNIYYTSDHQKNIAIEKDIEETFVDLEHSIHSLTDQEEIQKRELLLTGLRNKYTQFKNTKSSNNIESVIESRDDLHNEISNKTSENIQFNQLESSMMQEQDEQLDAIARTMQSLNKQANMMSEELQDHMDLMGDLEQDMDIAGDKIAQSSNRLDWIYKTNRLVGYNDCCITLLIVVLLLLLIVLIAI
ncbi:hypothetical protein HANVADRAFT_52645 [Hanseniaspora valbyensis NRRL Y-1626]|uniref:t-SNARE coiled-coil homology domain-containing protein n=1 Tax=Hanseniaspora valbyensis NRRL Y-1626 TaxID=766949 RepID=A0A1B7TEG0_9ASCO|nr:hypothetical protein HANVADRAFT_52645 [Hanseniaspora valbyensis NRRL Y-1626]